MSREPKISDEQKSLSGHDGFKKFVDQVPEDDRELFLEILLDVINEDMALPSEARQDSNQNIAVLGTRDLQSDKNS